MKRKATTPRPRKRETPPAFWLVWGDGYNSTPHFKHESEASARGEAERLAAPQPGEHFYVLQAKAFAVAMVNPVTWGEAVTANTNIVAVPTEDVPF